MLFKYVSIVTYFQQRIIKSKKLFGRWYLENWLLSQNRYERLPFHFHWSYDFSISVDVKIGNPKIINYPLFHSHEIGFSSQVPSGLSLIHIAPFKSSDDGEFNISFFRITHSLIELTTASDFVPAPSNITKDIDL